MKFIVLTLILVLFTSVCMANPVVTASNNIETSMTIHEWAHFGVGYIANDQLKRHTKLTTLERVGVVAFLGYAKEKWIDQTFTKSEFLATAAGGLFYEIKF